jgi:hypothetical protein
MSQPKAQELIPPKVLPAVAVARRLQVGSSPCVAKTTNTTSELPGNTVEERNALRNKPKREYSLPVITP